MKKSILDKEYYFVKNYHTNQPLEEIEGIEKPDDLLSIGYPIDTVLIRSESRTVYEVTRRIEKGGYIMDPDFQRDFIWPEDKQSKLIESVLMRIPLPVFYLAEDPEGRMIIVDGLQRISTFERFLKNELSLKLKHHPDLNGKKFLDLPPKLQNRVEDCNLSFYVIDSKVPLQALLDIFDRVNSGVALSRQQMRNCLCNGEATKFLKRESNTDLFEEATGGSLDKKIMRDREFVNRFCAFFLLGTEKYKSDMDLFLSEALNIMNKFNVDQLFDLTVQFRRGLKNNFAVFDKHAFRRHVTTSGKRSVLNASLWDVMSTGLARYSTEVVMNCAEPLREAFYRLQDDPEFIESITRGTNDRKKVLIRFEKTNAMFEEVFGD